MPEPALSGVPAAAGRSVDVIKVLSVAVDKAAADVIFTVGSKPRIRLGGRLRTFGDEMLTPDICKKILYSLLTDDQKAVFEEEWEIDLAVNIRNVGRFRLNGFKQRGYVGCTLRIIPSTLPTVESLELPPVIVDLADTPRGLVLVTGPTGSGKSTLLASLVNKINHDHEAHIVTIEDPIEFVHPNVRSVVEQREVGTDTRSFDNALKYVLRQSPDVIMVGEMRDKETMAAAITLAETGHLVFSTLHTQTCAQTLDRIIDAFPAQGQNQVRAQLSLSLKAVISQILLPPKEGDRCHAAREIMVVTPAIAALLREGKQHMIPNSIQTGRQLGMVTLETSIMDFVEEGLVDKAVAEAKLSQIRTYEPKPSGGQAAAAAPKVEERPRVQQVELLDIEADAQPLVKPQPKPQEPPPDLTVPRQPLVILLAVAALGFGIFCQLKGPKAPIKPQYGYGATAAMAVAYALRWRSARKRNDEILREWIARNEPEEPYA